MIVYDRLWETMKKKGMSQYKLIRDYQISTGQIHRLRKNGNVSMHTLEMLCRILDCRLEEVMEYRKDEPQ